MHTSRGHSTDPAPDFMYRTSAEIEKGATRIGYLEAPVPPLSVRGCVGGALAAHEIASNGPLGQRGFARPEHTVFRALGPGRATDPNTLDAMQPRSGSVSVQPRTPGNEHTESCRPRRASGRPLGTTLASYSTVTRWRFTNCEMNSLMVDLLSTCTKQAQAHSIVPPWNILDGNSACS